MRDGGLETERPAVVREMAAAVGNMREMLACACFVSQWDDKLLSRAPGLDMTLMVKSPLLLCITIFHLHGNYVRVRSL